MTDTQQDDWHRSPHDINQLVAPDGVDTYWWKQIDRMNSDHARAAEADRLRVLLDDAVDAMTSGRSDHIEAFLDRVEKEQQ